VTAIREKMLKEQEEHMRAKVEKDREEARKNDEQKEN